MCPLDPCRILGAGLYDDKANIASASEKLGSQKREWKAENPTGRVKESSHGPHGKKQHVSVAVEKLRTVTDRHMMDKLDMD